MDDGAGRWAEDEEALERRFLEAIEARREGRTDRAQDLLRAVLKEDPRLAEPYLELATMAGDAGDLDEAEALARTALEVLRQGGQWIADLSEGELMGFALNLLGEIVMRQAEERVFGDPSAFRTRWNEAASLFAQACAEDPENEDARRNATHCRRIEG